MKKTANKIVKKSKTLSTRAKTKTKSANTLPYVLIRASRAGVHAGYLVDRDDNWVTLKDARRIWYWKGAASLSEIAVYGLNPKVSGSSKIAVVVPNHQLRTSDVCEVLKFCPNAKKSFEKMPEWRA